MEININEASAKELLAYYQEKCDEEARQAKKEGRLVCWSAALGPTEFFEAMDIAVCYPETHSAGCGAKKCSMDLLEVADQKGYNIDICSYVRNNAGYLELLKQEALTGETPEKLAKSKASRIPMPDMVFAVNNICNTILKWYENFAKELNIPFICLDMPLTIPCP